MLILTLNEERALPGCLASVSHCDDIVVLDSGSKDQTLALARAAGARVFVRPFDDFARQRNFAQRDIPFKYPWVFHLDADERMSLELSVECAGATWEEVDGFLVRPKVLWTGKWIPHASNFPSPEVRFVRAPQFEFAATGDDLGGAPHLRLGELYTSYNHDCHSHGEDECRERWRRHARCIARQQVESEFAHAFLGAPLLRLLSRCILRGGFLDGRAGLAYCWLLGRHEAWRQTELRRLRAKS